MFEAVAFAGGGNRCYWQGGFWDVAAPRLGLRPRLVVGASAGAFAAAYSLAGVGRAVRASVITTCDRYDHNVDWLGALTRRRPLFPVARLYRALLEETFTADVLATLRKGPAFQIAIARPPRVLPPWLSVPLGVAVYQFEKRVLGPVHPNWGRRLGFEPEFVSLTDLASLAELVDALMAAAAVPPFLPIGEIAGRPAADGGLVDNVPVAPLEPIEAEGGRTLVLLTRRYRAIPKVESRTYVQPSRPVRIGQFDITDGEAIRAAYLQGREDGFAFVREMRPVRRDVAPG